MKRLFAVIVAVGVALMPAVYAQDLYYVTANAAIPVTAANRHLFAQPEEKGPPLKAGAVTYNLIFDDVDQDTNAGFDHPTLGAARRAAVNTVMTYVLQVLNLNTGADIDIRFGPSLNDPFSGLLAQAGTFFWLSPGFQNGAAFEHLTTGVDPSGEVVDIQGAVNFGHTWNTDTTRQPTSGEYDLYTVLLHEITHGLGLLSLSEANGASMVSPNAYSYWDSYIARSDGSLLFTGSPPSFNGTASNLTSNALIFKGPVATSVFGNTHPPVFAPSPWQGGSSLSHWNDGIEGGGVMTPFLGTGQKNAVYRSLDMAALEDLGYTTILSGPVADFTASSTLGAPPFTVQFSSTSTAGASPITSYLWQFGDGTTSTAANPSHTYSSLGSYTVRLRVTTSIAVDWGHKFNYITAAVGPVASFSATPTEGGAPLTVVFTDTSNPGAEPITARLWEFGDGVTSTAQHPSHTYALPGAYTVSLTVTTSAGSNTASWPAGIAVTAIDSDGDGLPDHEEILLGTDPFNPDTDGDGVDDFTEVIFGYNPLSAADTPALPALTVPFFTAGP